MIILHQHKLCFLEKPKCGSRSLVRAITRPLHKRWKKEDIFVSNKNLHNLNFDYHHPNYLHVNLHGAIRYIQEVKKQNIQEYTFICLLRNPIDLFISLYCYDINRQNNRYHKFSCVEDMRNTIHYKMFTDNIFLYMRDFVNIKFFSLNNTDSLIDYLFMKHRIPIRFPTINVNQNKKELDISDLKDQILQDFPIYNTLYGQ